LTGFSEAKTHWLTRCLVRAPVQQRGSKHGQRALPTRNFIKKRGQVAINLSVQMSGGFFPGMPTVNFSRVGAKSGEILFYPFETKKTAFFAKYFI